VLKLDTAVDQGEQRVITADANIHARPEWGTALSHDDATRTQELAITNF